jgi:hypothetical protein
MQDLNIHRGEAVIEDDVQLIWQQVDLLFDTYPGQLQGDIEYGTDYERCLYELNLSADDLKFRMEHDIGSLDLRGYNFNVEVMLLKGTQRDIAVIQVDLTKPNRHYSKTYKIE